MTHLQLAALCAGIALIAGACFGVLLMRRRSLYTADPSPRAAAAIADLDDVATSAGYARRDVSWSSASAAELGSNDLTSKDGEHWTRADTLPEQVADRASTPEAATETPTFDQWSRWQPSSYPDTFSGESARPVAPSGLQRATEQDRLRATLTGHYLVHIICDHERKLDCPVCSCSAVDLGWHESVGGAVEAWADHVTAVAVGGSDTPADQPDGSETYLDPGDIPSPLLLDRSKDND